MASVSLCMIVKDEEKVLARCLESVAGFTDEIIIVDTTCFFLSMAGGFCRGEEFCIFQRKGRLFILAGCRRRDSRGGDGEASGA